MAHAFRAVHATFSSVALRRLRGPALDVRCARSPGSPAAGRRGISREHVIDPPGNRVLGELQLELVDQQPEAVQVAGQFGVVPQQAGVVVAQARGVLNLDGCDVIHGANDIALILY